MAVGVALVYGACFVAIRAGLEYAPPFAFAAARALGGGVTLLALAGVAGQPLLGTGVRWPALLAVALTSTTLGFGTMFSSQLWSGAGLASVAGNLQPLFVVALALVFLGEPLTRAKALALAVGSAGVALVVSPALTTEAGVLLALASSATLAVGNVLLKRLGDAPRVVVFSAWQLILGGLPLLALSAVLERGAPLDWSLELVALVALLALPGAALPYAAWNWLVRRGDVGSLSVFLFLTPVAGVVLAGVAYGERLSGASVLGLALTVLAALLVARSPEA
ncbi:MAG: DMT family transporter [Chloroflexi bacterium]|nr:DMT family transporter [Chloroflexota bacterium]